MGRETGGSLGSLSSGTRKMGWGYVVKCVERWRITSTRTKSTDKSVTAENGQ